MYAPNMKLNATAAPETMNGAKVVGRMVTAPLDEPPELEPEPLP